MEQAPKTVKVYDRDGHDALINEIDLPAWTASGWTLSKPLPKAPKGDPK